MKMLRVMAAMTLFLLLALPGAAQETMRLYVEEGAVSDGQAQRLIESLGLAMDGVKWEMTADGQALSELVLAGCAPDLAVCRPETARTWAREGLLLPLQTHIPDQKRMQRQVLDLCIHDEDLFMAPLIARHRHMAVNRVLFEQAGLKDLLNGQMYPVWYPAQFFRILEEFMLRGKTGMDIWHAEAGSSAAIETMVQAIGGGALLGEDGETCRAGSGEMITGVQWLADSVHEGLIGWQETREEALARFMQGETAIYIDWTQENEKRMESLFPERAHDIVTAPYPSAEGQVLRSFDLIGVCAFAGEDVRDAQLQRACALLYAAAQDILGPQGIWQDGALWPASLDGSDAGATLRSLMCAAVNEAVETGNAAEALLRVQTVMDALGAIQ